MTKEQKESIENKKEKVCKQIIESLSEIRDLYDGPDTDSVPALVYPEKAN